MRIRIKSLSPRSTKMVRLFMNWIFLSCLDSLLDIKQARDVLHLPFDPKQLNHNHQIITHKSHGAHRIVCIYCEPFVSKRKCEPFVLQPSLLVAWRYHTRQSLINRFCVGLCAGMLVWLKGWWVMSACVVEKFVLINCLPSPSSSPSSSPRSP